LGEVEAAVVLISHLMGAYYPGSTHKIKSPQLRHWVRFHDPIQITMNSYESHETPVDHIKSLLNHHEIAIKSLNHHYQYDIPIKITS
jgi:hypothetical protein